MFRSGIAFVSLLYIAGTAHADPQIDLGAYVGGDYLGDYNKLGQSWAAERYMQTAPVLGGRLSVLGMTDSLREGGTGFAYGVEAEVGMQPTWTKDSSSQFAPVIGYRGHGILRYGNRYQAILVAGVGGETVMSNASFVHTQTDPQFYWGLGFSVDVSAVGQLRIDGRAGYMPDMGNGFTTTFEAQLSLTRSFGEHHHFAEHHEHVQEHGETDTHVSKAGPTVTPAADKDTDGDGFPDSIDKCPNEPETVNGYQDEDGCPEPDSDHDGIIDALDKCPQQPEDKDGFQDEDGCPDPDNDGDGIPDAKDKCPNEAETINGYQDEDGCPDQVPDAIGKAHPAMKFAKGRGKLAADDEAALKPVIDVMVSVPSLRISVIAHPESKSRAAAALAQLRADTVRSYMTAHGVTDAMRIDAKVGDVAAKGPAIELMVLVGMKPAAGAAGGAF